MKASIEFRPSKGVNADQAQRALEITQQIASLKRELDEINNSFKLVLGPKSWLEIGGVKVTVSSTMTRESFKKDELIAAFGNEPVMKLVNYSKPFERVSWKALPA